MWYHMYMYATCPSCSIYMMDRGFDTPFFNSPFYFLIPPLCVRCCLCVLCECYGMSCTCMSFQEYLGIQKERKHKKKQHNTTQHSTGHETLFPKKNMRFEPWYSTNWATEAAQLAELKLPIQNQMSQPYKQVNSNIHVVFKKRPG